MMADLDVGEIADLESSLKDWEDLSQEYSDLEELYKEYRGKLDEVHALQKKCICGVKHQRYRLSAIQKQLSGVHSTSEGDTKKDLEKDILRRKAQLSQMEDYLPRQSGTYLKIILGSVNVSILDKEAKYQYKEQYEQFKIVVVMIACPLALISMYFGHRILDLIFYFLVVWYYCTLTIRESILKINGSQIKGWWRLHHFISTGAGGVLLVWPDGECYQEFRYQLMAFNLCLGLLSYLQFTYQKGCLYRLRTLGLRNNEMDITVDGFHSWMWKGLGFLFPFLFVGYLWQLYIAYTLYYLGHMESATWHVPTLCAIFAILGTGSITTTFFTIGCKIRDQKLGILKYRFMRFDKYLWTHKKRGSETSLSSRLCAGEERIAIRRRSDSEIITPIDEAGTEEESKDDSHDRNE